MGKHLLSALVVLIATTSHLQAQPASNARSDEDSARAFIAHRVAEQSARATKAADAANLGALNSLVRAVSLEAPNPRIVKDPQVKAQLNDSFLVDIAQSLAILGFKAGDLRSDDARREIVVAAAAARIRGAATLEQEILLADTVAIGTVVAATEQPSGDGYRSSIGIRVDESRKGGDQLGSILTLRRQSGVDGAGRMLMDSAEDPLPVGAKVALIGSKAAYGFGLRGQICRSCVVEQIPTFIVSGSALLPTGGYRLSGSLEVLK